MQRRNEKAGKKGGGVKSKTAAAEHDQIKRRRHFFIRLEIDLSSGKGMIGFSF